MLVNRHGRFRVCGLFRALFEQVAVALHRGWPSATVSARTLTVP